MKLYVVNELNEIDTNYNTCHGVYLSKDKALDKAEEVFKNAIDDLGGKERATINRVSDVVLQVYTEDDSITVNIDEVKDDEVNLIDKDSYIATILWTEEDIKDALKDLGYKATKKNINTVINNTRLTKTLEEMSTATGWDVIQEIITTIGNQLK